MGQKLMAIFPGLLLSVLGACKSEGSPGDAAAADLPATTDVHVARFTPAAGQTRLLSWDWVAAGNHPQPGHWGVWVSASGEIYEDGGIIDAGTPDRLIETVPVAEVLRMYDLAMQTRAGAQVWGSHCRDTGTARFNVYSYDSATGQYTAFAFQQDGEPAFVTLHPAVAEVRTWLAKHLNPNGRDTFADCTTRPTPVADCQACHDECVRGPTGALYCSGFCYGVASCVCSGGPAWVQGDQASGFWCADPS